MLHRSPALSVRARAALVVAGASLFFASLFAAQNYWRGLTFGPAPIPPFALTLYVAVCRWCLYGALAAGVAWLTVRRPIERGAVVPRIALHALAAGLVRGNLPGGGAFVELALPLREREAP